MAQTIIKLNFANEADAQRVFERLAKRTAIEIEAGALELEVFPVKRVDEDSLEIIYSKKKKKQIDFRL